MTSIPRTATTELAATSVPTVTSGTPTATVARMVRVRAGGGPETSESAPSAIAVNSAYTASVGASIRYRPT